MQVRLLLFIAAIFLTLKISAQPFARAVNDAYVITRMADKFHFQPRQVNDKFSADVFKKFLDDLDGQKIFFTAPDINILSVYKYGIDDQIKNRQSGFLQVVASLYQKRVMEVQKMVDDLCKSPFNFYFQEKFTVAEDTSYPINAAAQRIKVSKIIRLAILYAVIQNKNDIGSLTVAEQNKYLKNAEPELRAKIRSAFMRSINRMLQSTNTVYRLIGDEYCRAIALSYDPHTEYLPLTEKEHLETELGARNIAFGFTLKYDSKGNIIIDEIKPGSPAYKGGQINKGDKILGIQWEGMAPVDISGAGLTEINFVLNTNNHGTLILTLKKPDGTKRNVVLIKEKLENDLEESKVKSFVLKGEKTIGYISLPAFYEDWENEKGINGCANDVAKEILKLKKENINGLILDVRYNSGGSMQEAIELAGIFLDAGPLAQYRKRDGSVITLKDVNKGSIYDGPLMVLVNNFSASASEMVAATLQDYNRAVIVGSPTFGKATTQAVLPLDTTITPETDISKKAEDSYLKLTIAQIFRVTGKPIQGIGVVPDVVIPETNSQREKDNHQALSASSVAANKYYKPNQPMSFKKLNTAAKKQIEENSYFKKIQEYAEREKRLQVKQDVSLRLADALAFQKGLPPVSDYSAENKIYKVENHTYDNERLQLNKSRKQMNDDWREHISADEYVKLAYLLFTIND